MINDYYDKLIGADINELDSSINYRVVIKDGIYLTVTRDYIPDRINIEIYNNKIVRIINLG